MGTPSEQKVYTEFVQSIATPSPSILLPQSLQSKPKTQKQVQFDEKIGIRMFHFDEKTERHRRIIPGRTKESHQHRYEKKQRLKSDRKEKTRREMKKEIDRRVLNNVVIDRRGDPHGHGPLTSICYHDPKPYTFAVTIDEKTIKMKDFRKDPYNPKIKHVAMRPDFVSFSFSPEQTKMCLAYKRKIYVWNLLDGAHTSLVMGDDEDDVSKIFWTNGILNYR